MKTTSDSTVDGAGGGGGGGPNSISMDTISDDSVSLVDTNGDGSEMGRTHSTSGSGTTDIQPWTTQKCTLCTWTRRRAVAAIGVTDEACPAPYASNSASSTTQRTWHRRWIRRRRGVIGIIPTISGGRILLLLFFFFLLLPCER